METECEFRFGTHTHRGFSSCVSRHTYHILYNRCIHIGVLFGEPTTYDAVFYGDDVRSIQGKFEKKVTTYKKDFYMGIYSLRYSESIEQKIPDTYTLADIQPEWRCSKTRVRGQFKEGVYIDFTIVDSNVHQVEIELASREYMDDSDDLLQLLCKWTYLPYMVKLMPISVPSYRGMLLCHNRVFKYSGASAWYRVNKPVDMPIPIPDLKDYVVTYKYDGVRGLLCKMEDLTYWVNMQGIVCIENVYMPDNTVLDVESVYGGFIVLDVLLWKDVDVRNMPYRVRKERIDPEELESWMMPLMSFALRNLDIVWNFAINSSAFDGVILKSLESSYWTENSYKIKPINRQTIDLEMHVDGAYAYNKSTKGMVKWMDRSDIVGGGDLEEGIWEFQRTEEGKLTPVRKREDRRYPNTIDTINSVLYISRGGELVDVIIKGI